MTYRIRNWEKFQHFKDRRPSWIKLYRDLLENYDWYCLSGQAAKSLVMLWLLSSESDGVLPPRVDLLFRLRLKDNELDPIIDELVNHRFLIEADAEYKQMSSADYAQKNGFSSRYIKDSDKQIVFNRDGGVCRRCNSSENIEYDHVIPVSKGGSSSPDNLQLLCRSCNRKKRAALCVDDNCAMRSLETETETETETYTETEGETETNTRGRAKASDEHSDNFAAFWEAYPRRVAKGAAQTAWKKMGCDKISLQTFLDAIDRAKRSAQWKKDNGQFIPHPATWLNQRRWEDEPEAAKDIYGKEVEDDADYDPFG